MVFLEFVLRLLCLLSGQAQGCVFGGEMLTSTVFQAFGDDAVRWVQRAEQEPPALLMIREPSGILYEWLEIDDPKVIAAYLRELGTLTVDLYKPRRRPEGWYTTYIFYMRDGTRQTFVFQSGKACIRSESGDFYLYPTVGIEALEALDAAQLAQRSESRQKQVWAQTPDWFRFEDHKVELRLDENYQIGYAWSQRVEPKDALILIGDSYLPGWSEDGCEYPNPDAVEPWGQRSYTYWAAGAGEAVIRLTLTGPDGSIVREIDCKVRFTDQGIEALERVNVGG